MGNVTLKTIGAQLQQMALAKAKEDERRIQIEAQQDSQSWLSQWGQVTQTPLFTSQEKNLSSAIHEQATRLVNNATLQAIAIHLHEKHHDPKNKKSILQHLHNEFVTCPHEPERFKKSLHLCVKVLSSVLLPENKLDDTAYRTNFAYEEDSEEQSIFTSME